MKKAVILYVLVLSLFLSSCATGGASNEPRAGSIPPGSLLVTGESINITFTHADLQAFPQNQVVYYGVTYVGIPMSKLLKAALFDPEAVISVKVYSGDGQSASHGAEQIMRTDFLVAYATSSGDLPAEDGHFVLVWSDPGGVQIMRNLVEVQASE